tara:strand:- start:40 stop:258 length:219 start_codon:yes stop_codon:yes gene_type:complete
MRLILLFLFVFLPFSSSASLIIVQGEWKMVYKDKEKREYHKKREILLYNEDRLVKSCHEFEWGDTDKYLYRS